MAKYALELKSSAQKELDALDNALFGRLTAGFWLLLKIPGLQDARSSGDTETNGASM